MGNVTRANEWLALPLTAALLIVSPAWPNGLDLPAPAPLEVPSAPVGGPDPELVSQVLAQAVPGGLAAPALGPRVVAAVSPLTGETAGFASGPATFRPASTMKLLTAMAALETLGPAHTFSTRVALEPADPEPASGPAGPRTVVLIGGGDPLLARRPQPAAYPARADVGTLALGAAAALAEQRIRRVRLRFDSTLFSGPVGSPQWRADYLRGDIVAPITALWIDAGRPASGSGRVDDPASAAAAAFRKELARAGIRVVGVIRPASATKQAEDLAQVDSAPLAGIVEHLLQVSDNEVAEVISHHVGIATFGEGSFDGGARGVAKVLGGLGIPLTGAAIYDGSGLARPSRLSSQTLLAVLRRAARPDSPDLRAVLTGLPVAAFTGSLASRFSKGPTAGRGQVRAKTGTLTGVHGLAGLVTDQDGFTYAFVLVADRVAERRSLAARTLLDRLASALAACRCADK